MRGNMEANRLPEYCHIDAAKQDNHWSCTRQNELWILTNCRSLGDLGVSKWVEVILKVHRSTFLWRDTCAEERVRGSGIGGARIRPTGACGGCLCGIRVNKRLRPRARFLPLLSCL